MTERIRAFGPKIEKEKGSSAQEKSEKTEGPLQSLEKDKAQISGFNFALNLILDGTITDVEQLKAIANPRFDSEADNAYLRTNNNIVIPFANDFIRRRTLKGKEIIGEQVSVLENIVLARESASREKTSAEAKISGFNFALNLILDGTITDVEQLKAIANPRFDSEADNAYLRTNNNIVIPFANDFIRRRTLKGKEIIGEQVSVLENIVLARESASREKTSAEAKISGFNFALNLILDGTITDVEQLKAIANPRFDSEADNAYLRTNNNIVIPFANDFIRRRTLKGKEI